MNINEIISVISVSPSLWKKKEILKFLDLIDFKDQSAFLEKESELSLDKIISLFETHKPTIRKRDKIYVFEWVAKLFEYEKKHKNTSKDIESNLANLPENPKAWKVLDVSNFINAIGLSEFADNFKNNSVDGMMLYTLTPEDYLENLIKSPQKYKIFEKWKSKIIQNLPNKSKISNINEEEHKNSRKPSNNSNNSDVNDNELEDLKTKSCLILKKMEDNSNHAIYEKGGEIGREKTCEIQIMDREVSKTNSKVIFTGGTYYINDKKSLNGTFVKMDNNLNKIRIELKMVFEINNYHIKVIEVLNMSITVEIQRLEHEEDDEKKNQPIVHKKHLESITFLDDSKFFYMTMDENHPKGYSLVLKEKKEAKHDLEFKSIKDIKYAMLSPTASYDVWFRIPAETWFPMLKQMKIKISEHEFKILNGEFSDPGKCKCGRKADILIMNCYHIYLCHECITGNQDKLCLKCKRKILNYEKLYIEPFI